MKRKKVAEGDVIAIPLNDGFFGFGQVCHGGDFAFFDLKAKEKVSPEVVVQQPVLFRVPVTRDALSAAGWFVLGNQPLRSELAVRGRYKHRPVGSEQAFLYTEGRSTPASESELEGLEVLAIWFPHHVVERLERHFNADRPTA